MTDYQKHLQACLKLLGQRQHSVWEITSYLNRKKVATDLIDQIISKLISQKLLDDYQFSCWLIESRSRSRPKGERFLAYELKNKGVSEEIIFQALKTFDKQQEITNAIKILNSKSKTWIKNMSPYKYKTKAYKLLSSRGFSSQVIEKVINFEYNDQDVN